MDFSKNMPPLEPDRLLPPEDKKEYTPRKAAPKPSTASVIRILGGSILTMLLIIFALVQFYGKNERLIDLSSILVSPASIERASFSDVDPLYKNKNLFHLESVKWIIAGKEDMPAKELNAADYDALFKFLSKDRSIRVVTDELEDDFQKSGEVSTLTIYVKAQDKVKTTETKTLEPVTFQMIQFLQGSPYYRVAMRQSGTLQWVYFRHDGPFDSLLEKL